MTTLSWRPDSKVLVSGAEDGKFVLWDMNDGWASRATPAHTEKSESRYTRRTGILDLAFSPQGKIATIGRDRHLRLWKADGAKDKDVAIEGALPTQVALVSDGVTAVTGNLAGELRIWNTETSQLQQKVETR